MSPPLSMAMPVLLEAPLALPKVRAIMPSPRRIRCRPHCRWRCRHCCRCRWRCRGLGVAAGRCWSRCHPHCRWRCRCCWRRRRRCRRSPAKDRRRAESMSPSLSMAMPALLSVLVALPLVRGRMPPLLLVGSCDCLHWAMAIPRLLLSAVGVAEVRERRWRYRWESTSPSWRWRCQRPPPVPPCSVVRRRTR